MGRPRKHPELSAPPPKQLPAEWLAFGVDICGLSIAAVMREHRRW
jgi:hypothetical protein